jgi:hypothetical protein
MSTGPGPGDDRAVDVEALWRVLATRAGTIGTSTAPRFRAKPSSGS